MFSKLFFCLIFLTALTPLYSQEPLAQQLKSIIENKKATVGIAVLYNGKILVTVNDKAGYPMMSTFKFPLALAVLERLDKQGLPLETELFISKPDLHPDTYSPLREARPEGNFKITIGELLKYSVALSDNNACDILFKYIGGPLVTEKYIHGLGIKDVAISQTEAKMMESEDNCMLNWTKPSAAVLLLETFLQNQMFSKNEVLFLERAMADCKTGNNKLKAGLPKQVLFAHKTGSSGRNEFGYKVADNDMGFVVFPNGQYYTIAVFIMNSRETDQENAKIMADISRTVYEYFVNNYHS